MIFANPFQFSRHYGKSDNPYPSNTIMILLFTAIVAIAVGCGVYPLSSQIQLKPEIGNLMTKSAYWFVLDRFNNREYLYIGIPGDEIRSHLIKVFMVKTGIPGERPTPQPQRLGREYWLLTEKRVTFDDPVTAPYFLALNIPGSHDFPFGPVPYRECGDTGEDQCNWIIDGEFGLHGIGGDLSRMSPSDPGSSGCIRHTDDDITYLYHLINPSLQKVRYYVMDDIIERGWATINEKRSTSNDYLPFTAWRYF